MVDRRVGGGNCAGTTWLLRPRLETTVAAMSLGDAGADLSPECAVAATSSDSNAADGSDGTTETAVVTIFAALLFGVNNDEHGMLVLYRFSFLGMLG